MFRHPGGVKLISDPDKLLSYAAWYYGRYAPPLSRLEKKLIEKADSPMLAAETFKAFVSYADDRKVLESRISFAAWAGKPMAKIRNALVRKGFDKEDVRSVIDEEEVFLDWNVRSAAIMRRLSAFANRGKSRAVARASIRSEFPEFHDRIEELFQKDYPDDRHILVQFHSFSSGEPLSESQRKKTYARLLRMGFRYSDVNSFLDMDV